MRKALIQLGLAVLFSTPGSGQFDHLEVVSVTRQSTDGPVISGFLEHTLQGSTWVTMRVTNLLGPLGNICVDWMWYDASGRFLDGDVSCSSAPISGPDVREFVMVTAPALPEDAELRVAFRHRSFDHFGDRISFRGLPERRAPALFLVATDTALACQDRRDAAHVAANPDDPDVRALLFTMVEERRCDLWAEGTLVDIMGVVGNMAYARAEGEGVSASWIPRAFLE